MDGSLLNVDQRFHIGSPIRRIALERALGGIGLSIIAIVLAEFGHLSPDNGAIEQVIIDLFVILNALRVAFPRTSLFDFKPQRKAGRSLILICKSDFFPASILAVQVVVSHRSMGRSWLPG